jgi:CDP-diacylglycerol--serine O-phosphatidyltransferase
VQLVGFDKDHFVGLPIPASAMTIAALVLGLYRPGEGLDPRAEAALPYLVVVLSLLMVSKIKYDTLPKISRRAIRREPWKFVFAVLAVAVVVVVGANAIFPLLLLFILLGIVRTAIGWVRRLGRPHSRYDDEDEIVEPTQIDS